MVVKKGNTGFMTFAICPIRSPYLEMHASYNPTQLQRSSVDLNAHPYITAAEKYAFPLMCEENAFETAVRLEKAAESS